MRTESERLKRIRQWVRDTKAQAVTAEPSISGHLASGHQASGPSTSGRHASDAIAITGVSGFFPGCMDVASFWRHLDRDEALITEIPAERFDWRAYYDPTGQREGSMRTKWGGVHSGYRVLRSGMLQHPAHGGG